MLNLNLDRFLDLSHFLAAAGLYMFLEGAVYALFPGFTRSLALRLVQTRTLSLRVGGLIAAILGMVAYLALSSSSATLFLSVVSAMVFIQGVFYTLVPGVSQRTASMVLQVGTLHRVGLVVASVGALWVWLVYGFDWSFLQ